MPKWDGPKGGYLVFGMNDEEGAYGDNGGSIHVDIEFLTSPSEYKQESYNAVFCSNISALMEIETVPKDKRY